MSKNENNKAENGNTVSVHYKGTLEDGTEFDSSYERGETLTFQVGEGQMIKGFDAAVVGMEVGETKNVTLSSHEAYGPHDPRGIQKVPKELFEADFKFDIGAAISGTNPSGQPVVGTILSEEAETVTLDFNHPMAGHSLNFQIELVDINESGIDVVE